MVALIISQTLNISLSADLTGDGVDDEVKVGEKSVIIIDGAQGKRYIPLKGVKILDYELFWSGTRRSYVLAALTLELTSDTVIPVIKAVVIGFSRGDFVVLDSLKLKWEPIRWMNWPSFETLRDYCSGDTVLAIVFDDEPEVILSKNLKFIEPNDRLEDEVYLRAGESKYISLPLRKGEYLFLKVILKNYDIGLRIECTDYKRWDEGRVSSYVGFFGGDDERFRITFDNSYSIFTSKEVHYTIIKFKSRP